MKLKEIKEAVGNAKCSTRKPDKVLVKLDDLDLMIDYIESLEYFTTKINKEKDDLTSKVIQLEKDLNLALTNHCVELDTYI